MRVRKELWNTWAQVSASQVKAFVTCARYWYFQSVLRQRMPQTPQQARGSAVHQSNENYLKTGTIAQDGWGDYVEAAKIHLPAFGSEQLLVEHEFSVPTFPGGPGWKGYIDLVAPNRPIPLILDHKTTSSFRWALTPAELATDIQVNSYARWLFEEAEEIDKVEVAHLNLLTSNKKKRTALYQSAIVSRRSVTAVWNRDLERVGQMLEARNAASVQDLEPNTQHCDRMYGKPCPYREQCKPQQGLLTSFSQGANEVNLMDKILANKQEKSSGSNGAANKESVPPDVEISLDADGTAAEMRHVGHDDAPPVLSSDGASRETPIANTGEKQATSKKRGRPKISAVDKARRALAKAKKLQEEAEKIAAEEGAEESEEAAEQSQPTDPDAELAAKLSEDAVQEATKPATQPVAAASLGRELTLYIDTVLIKPRDEYVTLFEDFIRPMLEAVEQAHGVADIRLIDFGRGKGFLSDEIRSRIDSWPEKIQINSESLGARQAIDVMTRYASQIIGKLG